MDTIEHKKGKIYYSMGEVAEMFDVNPSLIRFWESKFDILKPQKTKKGNRRFTPQDVDNLKLVYHLVKEKGMTLAGAQKRIKENPNGISRDMEITDRLLRIRSLLLEIREELRGDDGEVYRNDRAEGDDAPVAHKSARYPVPQYTAQEDVISADIAGEIVVAEITEEEFIALDDEPAPDYPVDELSVDLFEEVVSVSAAEQSLFEAPEESPKPRIIEQTLF